MGWIPWIWTQILFIQFFLPVFIFLSACAPSESRFANRNHLPAASDEVQGDSNPTIQPHSFEALEKQLPQLNQWIEEPSQDVLSKVVLPIQTVLFQASFLRNPKKGENTPGGNSTLKQVVSLLNRGILRAHQDQRVALLESKVLDHYKSTLTEGCQIPHLSSCKNLSLFRLDHQSVAVIKILVKNMQPDSIKEYYRLLLLAHDLQEKASDLELDHLLIDRSLELIKQYVYIKSLAKNSEGNHFLHFQLKSLTPHEVQSLKLYTDLFATILLKTKNNPSFVLSYTTLQELLSWMVQSNFPEMIGPSLSSRYLELIASQLQNVELQKKFSEIILAQKEESSPSLSNIQTYLAESYFKALQEIQTKNPRLLSMIGVSPQDVLINDLENSKDSSKKHKFLYFYIISNLFQFHSLERMTPFWYASDKNLIGFLSVMDHFMRIYFAHCALLTNLKMSEFFRRVNEQKSHPSELLGRAIDDTKTHLSPLWKDFFKRVARLKTFFEKEIDQQKNKNLNSEVNQAIQRTRYFFEHLHLNVKYLVTYPHLLMFSYYARKYDYSETFEVPGIRGGFKLDAKIIMHEMMEGKVPPLFIFTDYEGNNQPINSLEMMYAIYYTISTGLLDLYQVDVKDWFKKISEAYLGDSLDKLRNWTNQLSQWLNGNSFFSDFDQICNIALNPQAVNPTFENAIDLTQVLYNTFLGRINFNSSSIISRVVEKITPHPKFKNSLAEALELIRSDINPKLRNLKLLKSIFTQITSQLSAQERGGNLVLETLEKEIQSVDQMRTQVLQSVERYENKAWPCLFELSKQEHIRRSEILQMELEYLGHLFLALSALHVFHGKTETIGELRQNYPHPIWQEPFFVDLPKDRTLLVGINWLLQRKTHLTHAFEKMRGYEPDYLLNSGIQGSTHGTYYFVYRKLDLAVRLAQFLRYGYNGKTVSRKMDQIIIQYPDTLEELETKIYGFNTPQHRSVYLPTDPTLDMSQKQKLFQQSALKEFKNQAHWFYDIYGSRYYFRRWIQTAAALYKLKNEMNLDSRFLLSCGNDCIQNELEKIKLDAHKLLLLSQQVLEQVNLGAFTDDEKILDFFGDKTFFTNDSPGPRHLFIDAASFGSQSIGLTDEAYNSIISFHLGDSPRYRGFRKYADLESEEKVEDGGSMQGGDNQLTQEDLISRTDFFSQAENFYPTLQRQKELLLFPIEKTLLTEINHSFVMPVKTEIRLAYAFEQAVGSFEKNIKLPSMRFTLRNPKFQHPFLLSPNLKNNYRTVISSFNTRTYNLFLPEELQGQSQWAPTEPQF